MSTHTPTTLCMHSAHHFVLKMSSKGFSSVCSTTVTVSSSVGSADDEALWKNWKYKTCKNTSECLAHEEYEARLVHSTYIERVTYFQEIFVLLWRARNRRKQNFRHPGTQTKEALGRSLGTGIKLILQPFSSNKTTVLCFKTNSCPQQLQNHRREKKEGASLL